MDSVKQTIYCGGSRHLGFPLQHSNDIFNRNSTSHPSLSCIGLVPSKFPGSSCKKTREMGLNAYFLFHFLSSLSKLKNGINKWIIILNKL